MNGVTLSGICGDSGEEFEKLLEQSDAMYILSHPKLHYEQVRRALESGKACAMRSAGGPFCEGM